MHVSKLPGLIGDHKKVYVGDCSNKSPAGVQRPGIALSPSHNNHLVVRANALSYYYISSHMYSACP